MISPIDLHEKLQVLFWQETTFYRTADYLDVKVPTFVNTAAVDTAMDSSGAADPIPQEGIQQHRYCMGTHWREVMCEWAYNCKY